MIRRNSGGSERPCEEGALGSATRGFPCGSAGKESACNAGDLGLIPGLGRSLGEGNSYPLQYSGLEKSTDCIVHGVEKSQRRQSDFHFQRGLEFIANLTKPLLQTHRSLRINENKAAFNTNKLSVELFAGSYQNI